MGFAANLKHSLTKYRSSKTANIKALAWAGADLGIFHRRGPNDNYGGIPPYDHPFIMTTFCGPNKSPHISYLKSPLIRPPRYYDQRPPFGVLSPYFLYKITPLIRLVKLPGEEAQCLRQTQSDKQRIEFY